jgi:hypothetical protein
VELPINTTFSSNTISPHHHLPSPLVSAPNHDIGITANVLEDAPQTMSESGAGLDPRQVEDTFVLEEKTIDSSYIIGSKPGVGLCTISVGCKLTSIAICI